MVISVCITVFNEEGSIADLLDSLLTQTKKPDEIVIVDGRSNDKTVEIIRHYQKKDKRIKLLIEKGGIARGRNISIEIAKGEIIVMTDAGCVAKPDWLEKITHPFKYENVEIVAGFYDMPAKNPMNQAISVFHGIPPQRFDPQKYLPAARSVAFKKQVWEQVGGFDEKLGKGADDTKFIYEVIKRSVKIVRVKEARVVWNDCEKISLKESLKKMYRYAKGDAQAGIWWHPSQQFSSHNIKISLIFLRYFLGLVILVLAVKNNWLLVYLTIGLLAYLAWPVLKWKDVISDWRARIWLPVIQISSDITVMAGFVSGFLPKK